MPNLDQRRKSVEANALMSLTVGKKVN